MTHARPGRRCPRPLREVSGRARISGGYVAFAQRQSGDTQATAVHHQDGVSRRLIPFTPAAASRRGCRKKGSEKLWNLTGGRRIGIRRSDEVLVPLVGHLRPPRAWVVPSQIDAPDLWVVCATASTSCRRPPARDRLPRRSCIGTRRQKTSWRRCWRLRSASYDDSVILLFE
jgi:hypothetical protein